MRVRVPLKLSAQAIRAKESHFPMFLLTALLPSVVFPLARLDGVLLQRTALPLSVTLLVLESLRAMPAWVAQLGPIHINGIYRFLGLFSVVAVWLPLLPWQKQLPFALQIILLGLRAVFYLLTAIRIVQVLANCERVSGKTLSLGAAGYVHLGLTAGLLATVLQMADPDSFNLGAVPVQESLAARLSYFSFVTLGSLGYGDVVPASPIGESFAVLLSLSSTLYLSLLIGLLLSRFISAREDEIQERTQ
jgi:hypothetical protein